MVVGHQQGSEVLQNSHQRDWYLKMSQLALQGTQQPVTVNPQTQLPKMVPLAGVDKTSS